MKSIPIDKVIEILSEQVVAFHPIFARITESTVAGIFLSQALYWYRREGKKEFSKSQKDWEEYTSLTRYEQETARKKLRDLGVLEERNAPLEHRLYYSIKTDILYGLLVSNSHIPECGNPALGGDGIPHSLECGNPASVNKEEKEKEERDNTESSSPSAGGAFPQYDFGTFKSLYPDHRMFREKNERAARDAWNELGNDPQVKVAIIQNLAVMVRSKAWTKDGGDYVPNPQKYLRERQWEHIGTAAKNHREECEKIRTIFLEKAELDEAYCKLTEARYEMLSQRWDDALEKAEGGSPENALSAIGKAIDACVNSHFTRSVPKHLTLESIFKTTEEFEKWILLAFGEKRA